MLAPSSNATYRVRLDPLPDLDYLRLLWLELESRAAAGGFLSWRWIGTWLALICPRQTARLLSVHLDGRLVGLGVLTVRRRWWGLGPKHLRLHETGHQELDNLTIEYNGLLCEQGLERDVLAAAVEHLAEHDPHWLTLYLPGIDIDQVPFERLRAMTIELRTRRRATHYVDLAGLRESGQAYLPTVLSPKARGNVRRTARKLAAGHGEIHLTVARDTRQRLDFFHAMAALHQAYWSGDADEHGAFGDPRILRFHEQLLAGSEDREGAQLIRLSAGDRTVGYVYNLIWRDVVYFYQAGIDYPSFGNCGSPGLLLLTEVIQHALDDGYRRFELMAGDAEYKRTLGMAEGKMVWLSLDRSGWPARVRKAWWSLRGQSD